MVFIGVGIALAVILLALNLWATLAYRHMLYHRLTHIHNKHAEAWTTLAMQQAKMYSILLVLLTTIPKALQKRSQNQA